MGSHVEGLAVMLFGTYYCRGMCMRVCLKSGRESWEELETGLYLEQVEEQFGWPRVDCRVVLEAR